VVAAVQRANPGVAQAISGAGTTLAAIGGEARALQSALGRVPKTMEQAQTTLARTGFTLAQAGQLTDRLAPGVVQLRKLLPPLDRTLATVVDVGPDARGTLRTARRAAPDIAELLSRVRAKSSQVESIGRQAAKQLKCIRPYSPEIGSIASTWSDFLSHVDERDKLLRVQVQSQLAMPTNINFQNSAAAAKAFPGMTYAFPRPPGTNAGQPWFLPECGAGPDALDPSTDPESRSYDLLSQLPTPKARKTP
jgi:ABC-type transporter Mla subunit MlaD